MREVFLISLLPWTLTIQDIGSLFLAQPNLISLQDDLSQEQYKLYSHAGALVWLTLLENTQGILVLSQPQGVN